MPRLLSVNVGLPRDVTWNGKTVRTAIWKSPVDGRRMERELDIDGRWRGLPPGICSYAVSTETQISLSIFEGPTDSKEESYYAF
jgi:hypothetical protein